MVAGLSSALRLRRRRLPDRATRPVYRENISVHVSYDECRTWAVSKVLYPGLAAYSDLTVVDADTGTLGCLFEVGCNIYAERIVFARFPLAYVTG